LSDGFTQHCVSISELRIVGTIYFTLVLIVIFSIILEIIIRQIPALWFFGFWFRVGKIGWNFWFFFSFTDRISYFLSVAEQQSALGIFFHTVRGLHFELFVYNLGVLELLLRFETCLKFFLSSFYSFGHYTRNFRVFEFVCI